MIATDTEFSLEIGEKWVLMQNFKTVLMLQERIQIAEVIFSLDPTKAAAFVRAKESHAQEKQII